MSKKKLGEDLFAPGGSVKYTHHIGKLVPLNDNVIVRDMDFSGRKLASGILLLNDDGKTDGIRPRWAKVYAVGPEQTDVVPGQWVLIEHGRWSRGLEVDIDDEVFTIRRVDPDCIMFVSDEQPEDINTISTALHAERKELNRAHV
jgi:co-chaperonin GroES (HSP10)